MAQAELDRWLTAIGGHGGIDLTLERVDRVWRRLGAPRPGRRIVTVGGTNGKGTCAHFLDRCLRAQGRRTALYTSPHLLRFNERVCIDGEPIDDAALCAAFERVEAARDGEALTFFEFTTLAALCVFADHGADVAILEVGLGGRLDAVNVIEPDVAVVTTVALDHQDYLGDTRDEIGTEKAGIFRRGRPAVCADPAPPASLVSYARSIGAELRLPTEAFRVYVEGAQFGIDADLYRLAALPRPGAVPLAGFVAAIDTLALLGEMPAQHVLADILRGWALPGRQQRVAGRPEWLIDVAHNAEAAGALAARLAAEPVAGSTRAVIGLLADKPAVAFVAALEGCVDEWFAVSLPGDRGQDAAALRAHIGAGETVACCESVAAALALARARSAAEDRVLVCGSFQIAGPALAWLGIYSRQQFSRPG